MDCGTIAVVPLGLDIPVCSPFPRLKPGANRRCPFGTLDGAERKPRPSAIINQWHTLGKLDSIALTFGIQDPSGVSS